MRGLACCFNHARAVPCEPGAAAIAGTVNKPSEALYFYHITVGSAAIEMARFRRIVLGTGDPPCVVARDALSHLCCLVANRVIAQVHDQGLM